jgi:hypothetical protein
VASGILYLDVDDEITSVAGRIRQSEHERIAIVLPYGSRVATSRINLRLLARDATIRGKRLSIVAGDAATRALAASAGLPAFSTVGEYEESLVGLEQPTAREAPVDPALGKAVVTAATAELAAPAAPAAPAPEPRASRDASQTQRVAVPSPAPLPAATSLPVVASRRGFAAPRPGLIAVAAALALVILVVGVGSYVLLPSATIVVAPRLEPIGPIRLSVVADPDGGTTGGSPVIAAERLTVDVETSRSFEATGVRVEETKATGRVTFQSFNPAGANTIPSGSIVSTEGGIRFATTRSITLAKAQIVPDGSGAVIIPTRASVDVEAVQAGPGGNVPANAITVVPRGEDPTLTKVRNGDETTGGVSEEFPQVTQEDVDGALVALGEELDRLFMERLADPALPPAGTRVFPGTAVLGELSPSVDPTTLVEQEVATFELGGTAQGEVTAVDTTAVDGIAAERVASEVSPGSTLVDGSTDVSIGEPRVTGDRLTFPVVIEAAQVQAPDAAELERLVLGRPIEEARQLLSRYGEVELSVWPDWVTTIPSIDGRVELEIRGIEAGAGATDPPETDAPEASP